jgi:hypothetical protein
MIRLEVCERRKPSSLLTDWKLYGDAQFCVCHVCLFVSQTHGADKPLVLDGSTSKV